MRQSTARRTQTWVKRALDAQLRPGRSLIAGARHVTLASRLERRPGMGPRPPVRTFLHALRTGGSLMRHATAVVPAAATAAKPRPQTRCVFEVAIAPDPVRVAQIRHITTAFLRCRAVPAEQAAEVVLVVSELVANAIEHGHGTVTLRLWHTDSDLCVEVIDDNPAPARLRAAGDDDEFGRGLLLVAALCRNWGASDDGRATWCTFPVPAGRA
jgi:serine/threonine-protein kinase RsbW